MSVTMSKDWTVLEAYPKRHRYRNLWEQTLKRVLAYSLGLLQAQTQKLMKSKGKSQFLTYVALSRSEATCYGEPCKKTVWSKAAYSGPAGYSQTSLPQIP